MEEFVFNDILKRVEKLEKEWDSFENFVIKTTFGNDQHSMRMKEDFSFEDPELLQVYQDLKDLELADLLDYQNFVGRFDGEFC